MRFDLHGLERTAERLERLDRFRRALEDRDPARHLSDALIHMLLASRAVLDSAIEALEDDLRGCGAAGGRDGGPRADDGYGRYGPDGVSGDRSEDASRDTGDSPGQAARERDGGSQAGGGSPGQAARARDGVSRDTGDSPGQAARERDGGSQDSGVAAREAARGRRGAVGSAEGKANKNGAKRGRAVRIEVSADDDK